MFIRLSNKVTKYIYHSYSTFTDDYLGIQKESTDLFKKIFSNEPIEQISLSTVISKTDDYGNKGYEKLSYTQMNRETYNKINWDNFDYSKLNKITKVYFYGESLTKNLEDLEKASADYECDSALTMCESFGDCDKYLELVNSNQCDFN